MWTQGTSSVISPALNRPYRAVFIIDALDLAKPKQRADVPSDVARLEITDAGVWRSNERPRTTSGCDPFLRDHAEIAHLKRQPGHHVVGLRMPLCCSRQRL